MQKEMDQRLQNLTQDMKNTMNSRIAKTTHRAIQENIALNKELDAMLNICKQVDEKFSLYKERDRKMSLEKFVFESEAKSALKKVVRQNRLIEDLKKERYKLSHVYGEKKSMEIAALRNENLVEEYKIKIEKAEKDVFRLEQENDVVRKNKEQILKNIRETCAKAKEVKEILRRAKEYIEFALNVSRKNLATFTMWNFLGNFLDFYR